MKRAAIYLAIYVLLAIILLPLATFLMAAVWGWVIPDIFKGLVEVGLLPTTITWWQAIKIYILLLVFGLAGAKPPVNRD